MEPIPSNNKSATKPKTSRKTVHWNNIVQNLEEYTLDKLNSERFDEEVVDSVKKSTIARQSIFSMGSLFSEDSVSRELGGFTRSKRASRVSDVSMMTLEDDDEGMMNRRGSVESLDSSSGDLEHSVQVLPAGMTAPLAENGVTPAMKRISEGDENSGEDLNTSPETTSEASPGTKKEEVQVAIVV